MMWVILMWNSLGEVRKSLLNFVTQSIQASCLSKNAMQRWHFQYPYYLEWHIFWLENANDGKMGNGKFCEKYSIFIIFEKLGKVPL